MAWCVREINILRQDLKKNRKATNRDNASWHGSASPGDAEAPGLVVDEHHQPEGNRQPQPSEVAAGAANDTVSLAEETTQKEVRGNYHGLYKVAYSFFVGRQLCQGERGRGWRNSAANLEPATVHR